MHAIIIAAQSTGSMLKDTYKYIHGMLTHTQDEWDSVLKNKQASKRSHHTINNTVLLILYTCCYSVRFSQVTNHNIDTNEYVLSIIDILNSTILYIVVTPYKNIQPESLRDEEDLGLFIYHLVYYDTSIIIYYINSSTIYVL